MRDNHTFRKLSEIVDEALLQIKEEWDAGFTGGMLCTHRKNAPSSIHADNRRGWEDFRLHIISWYEEVPSPAGKEG